MKTHKTLEKNHLTSVSYAFSKEKIGQKIARPVTLMAQVSNLMPLPVSPHNKNKRPRSPAMNVWVLNLDIFNKSTKKFQIVA